MKNQKYWLSLILVSPLLFQTVTSVKAMQGEEETTLRTSPIGQVSRHPSRSIESIETSDEKIHPTTKKKDEVSASHVVILGGGIGGVVAANTLRELLPQQYKITVIDRSPSQILGSTLLGVMIGDREPQNILNPLSHLRNKGIEFVEGVVTEINPETKTVKIGNQEIHSDSLIISLGAELIPENIPGLTEGGHNLYTLTGSQTIAKNLNAFQGGKIVILTASPAYKCPAAPYEASMLLEYECRKKGIREKTEIQIYAAEPGPMGTAGPKISNALKEIVESKKIRYFPGHQIIEVKPETRKLHFASGLVSDYDLLIYVPPHQVPAVLKGSGLLGENGWVSVDPNTLVTRFKDVYAIGDVTSIPLKMGKPLPKAAVFAYGQAEVVAHNIAKGWLGTGESKSFDGFGECIIEMGDLCAAKGHGNFYAEPTPQIVMEEPEPKWHSEKELFEESWPKKWF
jgi:sulfide:quinone oxidoreductase